VALSRRPDARITDGETPVPLSIVSLRAEPALVQRMQAHLRAWDAAGRPRTDALRIAAYLKAHDHPVPSDAWTLDKRWTTVLVSR
jgi:hypothetical protein